MEVFLKVMGVIAVFFILALLFALPVMWLWNWLMPVIFGLTKITFLQALGVNILAGMLFRTSSSSN